MKFSELKFRYYEDQIKLENFLRNNPRFNDAEIIKDSIDYNFDHDYQYNQSWTVEMKGKWYNVIFNDPDYRWGLGRKQRSGFIYKRFYRPEETKIIHKRKECVARVEHTSKSVRGSTKFYRNDCQIWTLAKCCDLDYDTAAKVLFNAGWTEKNTWYFCFCKAIDSIGFQQKLVFSIYRDTKGITLKNVLKILPAIGTFEISVGMHILCVVDGVIYDSYFNPNARVRIINEIVKKVI